MLYEKFITEVNDIQAPKWYKFHHMLHEIPHCDSHHINGDLMLAPWNLWIDLGEIHLD